MTKTFFRQLCIYQKYYSPYTNRSYTPAPPGLISMDFMKKSGGWFFNQHGTKVVFKKPPCEMEAWLQADGGHLAGAICVIHSNNKKPMETKRFDQLKSKVSLLLGRNGPSFLCVLTMFCFSIGLFLFIWNKLFEKSHQTPERANGWARSVIHPWLVGASRSW